MSEINGIRVEDHYGLAYKMAYFYSKRIKNSMHVDDLAQEGMIGVMEAAKRFDGSLGFKFATYANYWIMAYMQKYLVSNIATVRTETFDNTRIRLLTGQLEQMVFSLDDQLKQDGTAAVNDATFVDGVIDESPSVEESISLAELQEAVRKAAEKAASKSAIDQDIIESRSLSVDPQTYGEIGKRYNLSRQRIEQREKRLMRKMKKELTEFVKQNGGLN